MPLSLTRVLTANNNFRDRQRRFQTRGELLLEEMKTAPNREWRPPAETVRNPCLLWRPRRMERRPPRSSSSQQWRLYPAAAFPGQFLGLSGEGIALGAGELFPGLPR